MESILDSQAPSSLLCSKLSFTAINLAQHSTQPHPAFYLQYLMGSHHYDSYVQGCIGNLYIDQQQSCERLEIRWLEWTGKKPNYEVRRGMPMTMPPIHKADIMDLKLWTQMGCPTGTGKLCLECQ